MSEDKSVYGVRPLPLQRQARDKNIRRIEYAFYNERLIRDAVEEARQGARHETVCGSPNHISDPTASAAIRATEELTAVTLANGGKIEMPERWLDVIEAVRAWCASDAVRAGIFRRKYADRDGAAKIQRIMGISDSTYKYTLREMRIFAVQCAAQAQVVRVF